MVTDVTSLVGTDTNSPVQSNPCQLLPESDSKSTTLLDSLTLSDAEGKNKSVTAMRQRLENTTPIAAIARPILRQRRNDCQHRFLTNSSNSSLYSVHCCSN